MSMNYTSNSINNSLSKAKYQITNYQVNKASNNEGNNNKKTNESRETNSKKINSSFNPNSIKAYEYTYKVVVSKNKNNNCHSHNPSSINVDNNNTNSNNNSNYRILSNQSTINIPTTNTNLNKFLVSSTLNSGTSNNNATLNSVFNNNNHSINHRNHFNSTLNPNVHVSFNNNKNEDNYEYNNINTIQDVHSIESIQPTEIEQNYNMLKERFAPSKKEVSFEEEFKSMHQLRSQKENELTKFLKFKEGLKRNLLANQSKVGENKDYSDVNYTNLTNSLLNTSTEEIELKNNNFNDVNCENENSSNEENDSNKNYKETLSTNNKNNDNNINTNNESNDFRNNARKNFSFNENVKELNDYIHISENYELKRNEITNTDNLKQDLNNNTIEEPALKSSDTAEFKQLLNSRETNSNKLKAVIQSSIEEEANENDLINYTLGGNKPQTTRNLIKQNEKVLFVEKHKSQKNVNNNNINENYNKIGSDNNNVEELVVKVVRNTDEFLIKLKNITKHLTLKSFFQILKENTINFENNFLLKKEDYYNEKSEFYKKLYNFNLFKRKVINKKRDEEVIKSHTQEADEYRQLVLTRKVFSLLENFRMYSKVENERLKKEHSRYYLLNCFDKMKRHANETKIINYSDFKYRTKAFLAIKNLIKEKRIMLQKSYLLGKLFKVRNAVKQLILAPVMRKNKTNTVLLSEEYLKKQLKRKALVLIKSNFHLNLMLQKNNYFAKKKRNYKSANSQNSQIGQVSQKFADSKDGLKNNKYDSIVVTVKKKTTVLESKEGFKRIEKSEIKINDI